MKVKIVNHSPYPLPAYATALSAGLDLKAHLDAPVLLKPLQRALIPTGLYLAIPEGYEAQVRPAAVWPRNTASPCSTARGRSTPITAARLR